MLLKRRLMLIFFRSLNLVRPGFVPIAAFCQSPGPTGSALRLFHTIWAEVCSVDVCAFLRSLCFFIRSGKPALCWCILRSTTSESTCWTICPTSCPGQGVFFFYLFCLLILHFYNTICDSLCSVAQPPSCWDFWAWVQSMLLSPMYKAEGCTDQALCLCVS